MTRPAEDPRDCNAVDGFPGTLIAARSLQTACEIGLVDHLLQRGCSPLRALRQDTGSDARGPALLLNLLRAGCAVQECLGLSGDRRWLDVGGNSGRSRSRACRRHAGLQATVLVLRYFRSCSEPAPHAAVDVQAGKIELDTPFLALTAGTPAPAPESLQ